MRSMVAMAISLLSSSAFAFFPFSAEDTQALGGLGKFQLEFQSSYFRNYDNLKHTDLVLQFTAGVLESMDFAVLFPYIVQFNEENVKGWGDAGVFIKHVPISFGNTRVGYKVQANLDTGKEGLGYGKTTYNFNLMIEHNIDKTTFNLNLVYSKYSHVGEYLRDSKGVYIGVYQELKEEFVVGGELKYLIPEDINTDKKDVHILLGGVYSPREDLNLSLGIHKSLNKYEGFADYGVLAGVAVRF